MVVCHCLALNDRAIAELARSGTATVDDITAACGAGGKCGGCRPLIEEVVDEAVTSLDRPVRSAA